MTSMATINMKVTEWEKDTVYKILGFCLPFSWLHVMNCN